MSTPSRFILSLAAFLLVGVTASPDAIAQGACGGDPLLNIPPRQLSPLSPDPLKDWYVYRGKRVYIPQPVIIAKQGRVVLSDAHGKQRPLVDAKGRLAAVRNGDTLQTGGDGFASIRSTDGSRLVIPTNSKVHLKNINQNPIQIELQKGRVENYVTDSSKSFVKNKGRTSYQIRTPAVTLSVRGTEFRVAYNEADNTARTAISQGLVAAQKPAECAPPDLLERGDGALVSKQGIKKVAMLPAPDLSALPVLYRGPDMIFTLKPVEKAIEYHMQAATDEAFIAVVKESYSSTPIIKFSDLPGGFYYVRFTAIDTNGIEGFASSDQFLYQPDTPYMY